MLPTLNLRPVTAATEQVLRYRRGKCKNGSVCKSDYERRKQPVSFLLIMKPRANYLADIHMFRFYAGHNVENRGKFLSFNYFQVVTALVVSVSAEPEADPQYIAYTHANPYQPVLSYHPQPQVVAYPQVAPVSYAEPKKDYTPTLYNAEPKPFIGVWNQIREGSGNYLPDVFGWDRGNEYFNKWLNVPVQLRANRVRWRTDGQRMRNGFNSASGADPNKYTDKLSYPGSYQGRRRKREADADPQYVVR